jgi:hypothetical protein
VRVRLDPHAAARILDRGCTDAEVEETVRTGERFAAKYRRTGFRHRFPGPWQWRGRMFDTKEVEAYAVEEVDGWLVITVITRYY